ncbi:MAG: DUF481 domain-containing protein [Acidobacteriaceae bacterium]|nr:DUF481 domain-containing protein [Acidobacteriaceae bacterium]
MNISLFRAATGMSLLLGASIAFAQSAAKPAPDVLVFSNGDQLTGKLEKITGGSVQFQTDMAGEVSIGFDKIKSVHSSSTFVLFRKQSRGLPESKHGEVVVEDGKLTITPKAGTAETITTADVLYLVDEGTYEHDMARKAGFSTGWNGTVTGGATLVQATNSSTTLTAGIALVRALPTVAFLPPRNRTTLNLTETYGKQTSPVIPPTDPASPDVITKTSIFHFDGERDEYITERFYALVDSSLDHNYSQGLSLQQIYGGGVGWTPIKSAVQELDLKAEAHYEVQWFMSSGDGAVSTPDTHLFGSTFAETYSRNLPHKIVFTESGNIIPGWTDMNAYSANVSAGLALPVYKRLSASVSATDNFLNNPAVYYKKNSFQFVTGVTYTLK